MAELIIKMIASKPKAATHSSVRAIVHLLFLQSHRPIPRGHRSARSDLERLLCESLS